MPKCQLTIELEGGPGYTPGQPITGCVVVRVLQPYRCEELSLSWRWRTQRRDRPDEGLPEKLLTLSAREEWLPGQVLRYPFRLEAPSSPFPSLENGLAADWILRAECSPSGILDTASPATEERFSLVLEKTPGSTATDPGSSWALEIEEPPRLINHWDVLHFLTFVGMAVGVFMVEAAPLLSICLIVCYLGYGCWRGFRDDTQNVGKLWLGLRVVARGTEFHLRLQEQAERSVRGHHVSVSLERAEAQTDRRTKGRDFTHEPFVRTILTRTCPALGTGRLRPLSLLCVPIPPNDNAPRWFLRIVVTFKGSTKSILHRLRIPLQPEGSTTQDADVPPHQALPPSIHHSGHPPWLQAVEPRKQTRRGPPPSGDARRKLEGGIEVLEAAHAHYTVLEKALQEHMWKLHVGAQLEPLRESLREEPARVYALERLRHRAHAEGWTGSEPALALAHEVEELRARVGALVSRRLDLPAPGEACLTRELERLMRSIVEALPAPLAPDEKLLLTGGFSPSLLGPGLLLLGSCLVHWANASGSPFLWGALWLAWMVLTAVWLASQYHRSGRFWLTGKRLIWLPTRGDPLQVSLSDIPPGGMDVSYLPRCVRVRLGDGRTLHFAFISQAARFAAALKHLLPSQSVKQP